MGWSVRLVHVERSYLGPLEPHNLTDRRSGRIVEASGMQAIAIRTTDQLMIDAVDRNRELLVQEAEDANERIEIEFGTQC